MRLSSVPAVLTFWVLVAATSLLTGCELAIPQFNPANAETIDFLADANRLSFGTSTGDNTQNFVTQNADGTVRLYASNDTYSAGKIAGSEDGITYLFREVDKGRNFKLSASVTIAQFGGVSIDGLTTSNGQEGFGLMARDYVPQYPGYTMAELKSPAITAYDAGETGGSSNMVMVGGIKRGVRAAIRRGVTGDMTCVTEPASTSDSSKSKIEWFPLELGDYSTYPRLEDRPDFASKGSTYQLTLEKTNNGFSIKVVPPAEKGGEYTHSFNEPNVLLSINHDKYYVGLFASRAADVTFSNISYAESDCSSDSPYIAPTAVVVAPVFSLISATTNSDGDYQLMATANVKGHVSVVQDNKPVPGAEFIEGTWVTEPSSAAVEPFNLYNIPVYTLKKGDNLFRAIFYPDESATITSNAPITKNLVVHRAAYSTAATPIYVSPAGSRYAGGTRSDPLDLDTAIAYVLPGQTIIMLNGTYHLLSFRIPRFNNGRFGAVKRIEAETRNQVIVDFDKQYNANGAVIEGDYWQLSGMHFRNTPDKKKGFTLMGSNNLVEWVTTYNNGDTGLQISGRSTEPKSMWPANNTIRYCESYDNLDAAMNDADGFAAKLTVGSGNIFQWCVAHNNCDDGWDLFTKKETGTIGVVTLENCITYQNGTLMNGTKTLSGRNGFKMGGEGLGVAHVMRNCLAFNNGAHGFTSNSNPNLVIENCTSFDNGGAWNLKAGADARNFTIYDGAGLVLGLSAKLTGILSLYTDPDNDGIAGDNPAIANRKEDKVQLRLPADGYAWLGAMTGKSEGVSTHNINNAMVTVANVVSTVVPLYLADGVTRVNSGGFLKRAADGKFALDSFLKPVGFSGGCQLY